MYQRISRRHSHGTLLMTQTSLSTKWNRFREVPPNGPPNRETNTECLWNLLQKPNLLISSAFLLQLMELREMVSRNKVTMIWMVNSYTMVSLLLMKAKDRVRTRVVQSEFQMNMMHPIMMINLWTKRS
jgi:hypothetical protein